MNDNIELDVKYNLDTLVNKAKLLGICRDINDAYGGTCYIIRKSTKEDLLVIPDSVKYLGDVMMSAYMFETPKDKLTVLGGKGLTCADKMFCEMRVRRLDLSRFDTSNVESMKMMFYNAIFEYLDLSTLDTRNVENMREMFSYTHILFAETLDLTSFDTRKVRDMDKMFFGSEIKEVDLSSFKLNDSIDPDIMLEYYFGKVKSTDKRLLAANNLIREGESV